MEGDPKKKFYEELSQDIQNPDSRFYSGPDVDTQEEIIQQGPEEKVKKRCSIFETFSKLWVSVLMIAAIVDLNLSYVLAFLGREQIAETLSIAIVTEIIGVMAIYLIRAFLDSHYEAKDKLNKEKLDKYQQIMGNMPSKNDSYDSNSSEIDDPEDDEMDDEEWEDELDDEESEG